MLAPISGAGTWHQTPIIAAGPARLVARNRLGSRLGAGIAGRVIGMGVPAAWPPGVRTANYPPGWMPASGIGSHLSTTRPAAPGSPYHRQHRVPDLRVSLRRRPLAWPWSVRRVIDVALQLAGRLSGDARDAFPGGLTVCPEIGGHIGA